MSVYKKILLAVDLQAKHDHAVTKRAVEIAKQSHAELDLIHVVAPMPVYGASQGYQIILDVEKRMLEDAQKALSELGNKYDIGVEHLLIVEGIPKSVILAKAKELKVDLIIVGSHSLHGLSLLFGSFADQISHRAECDVLVIHMKE